MVSARAQASRSLRLWFDVSSRAAALMLEAATSKNRPLQLTKYLWAPSGTKITVSEWGLASCLKTFRIEASWREPRRKSSLLGSRASRTSSMVTAKSSLQRGMDVPSSLPVGRSHPRCSRIAPTKRLAKANILDLQSHQRSIYGLRHIS